MCLTPRSTPAPGAACHIPVAAVAPHHATRSRPRVPSASAVLCSEPPSKDEPTDRLDRLTYSGRHFVCGGLRRVGLPHPGRAPRRAYSDTLARATRR
jgi:hypothetical protein